MPKGGDKRKRARADEVVVAVEAPVVGDVGDTRPSFAIDFPSDPTLDALVVAFVAGDYARVREEAPKLAASSTDDAVKAAARTLRDRIEPDRLALGLLALTGVLLVALTAWWISHGHAPTAWPVAPSSAAPSSAAPPVTIERIH